MENFCRISRGFVHNLGEDQYTKITTFDTAIEQLNKWILPAYKFSPDKLCLGLVVNMAETFLVVSAAELTEAEVCTQNQYVAQQGLDAYAHIVEYAAKRKAALIRRWSH